MTTQTRQGQRFTAVHLWYQVVRGASAALTSLGDGIERLAQRRAGATAHPAGAITAATTSDTAVASELFAEAVRENSNLELDWLWLAGRVTSQAERRYCLGRALAINPACEQARRVLSGRQR